VVIEARVNQLCVVLEKDDYEDGDEMQEGEPRQLVDVAM
jgi:hypothetical protein